MLLLLSFFRLAAMVLPRSTVAFSLSAGFRDDEGPPIDLRVLRVAGSVTSPCDDIFSRLCRAPVKLGAAMENAMNCELSESLDLMTRRDRGLSARGSLPIEGQLFTASGLLIGCIKNDVNKAKLQRTSHRP